MTTPLGVIDRCRTRKRSATASCWQLVLEEGYNLVAANTVSQSLKASAERSAHFVEAKVSHGATAVVAAQTR
ncbi:hypothetical protein ACU8NH_39185 (plasmid) [Rhizobium leguminosarum]|nr:MULTISPECIES: hypothetical protein [Rhizobium]MDV4183884.1 hypothetical protein [Rhizobium brockwellii]MDV4190874.1 hypothetical protein [Rhizobium brockwellii]QIO63481.1 hypothetical protein HA463_38540 [Rhizobium leguminosarum bv. trifolii]